MLFEEGARPRHAAGGNGVRQAASGASAMVVARSRRRQSRSTWADSSPPRRRRGPAAQPQHLRHQCGAQVLTCDCRAAHDLGRQRASGATAAAGSSLSTLSACGQKTAAWPAWHRHQRAAVRRPCGLDGFEQVQRFAAGVALQRRACSLPPTPGRPSESSSAPRPRQPEVAAPAPSPVSTRDGPTAAPAVRLTEPIGRRASTQPTLRTRPAHAATRRWPRRRTGGRRGRRRAGPGPPPSPAVPRWSGPAVRGRPWASSASPPDRQNAGQAGRCASPILARPLHQRAQPPGRQRERCHVVADARGDRQHGRAAGEPRRRAAISRDDLPMPASPDSSTTRPSATALSSTRSSASRPTSRGGRSTTAGTAAAGCSDGSAAFASSARSNASVCASGAARSRPEHALAAVEGRSAAAIAGQVVQADDAVVRGFRTGARGPAVPGACCIASRRSRVPARPCPPARSETGAGDRCGAGAAGAASRRTPARTPAARRRARRRHLQVVVHTRRPGRGTPAPTTGAIPHCRFSREQALAQRGLAASALLPGHSSAASRLRAIGPSRASQASSAASRSVSVTSGAIGHARWPTG